MQEQGREVGHIRDLVALRGRRRRGGAAADPAERPAARRVLAAVVNVLNPRRLVIGGDMVGATRPWSPACARPSTADATALATRQDLRDPAGPHGEQAGLVGCAALALEGLLSPAAVDRALALAEE